MLSTGPLKLSTFSLKLSTFSLKLSTGPLKLSTGPKKMGACIQCGKLRDETRTNLPLDPSKS